MTPEEKAKELIEKFDKHIGYVDFSSDRKTAKACAVICTQEIINEFPQGYKGNFEEKRKQYWQQVKEYLTMEENKK